MKGKHRRQGWNGRPLPVEWDKQRPGVYASVRQPVPSWPSVIATTLRLWLERRSMMQRRRVMRPENGLTRQTIRLALLIAGQRRAYLQDAWRADLYADDGRRLSAWRRSRHSAGYVVAAINYRLINDLGEALCRLLDAVLVSRAWTRAVIVCLFLVPCHNPRQSRRVRPRSKCRFACRGRRRPRCRTSLATSAAQNGASQARFTVATTVVYGFDRPRSDDV
jgi:hypothetical protein